MKTEQIQKEHPTVGITECDNRMKALLAERAKQDQIFGPKIDSAETNKNNTNNTNNVLRTGSKTQ